MGTGAWLAFLAWKLASQPCAMLAVTLLMSAPMLAVAAFLAHPDDPTDDLAGMHRVEASLRVVRLCRAHLGVAGSYVFVLWFCQLAGYLRLMEFLVFYTVACVAAAVASLPWLAARERRLHDQRAEYRRLLQAAKATAWQPAGHASHVG